jgi:uncharacterized protein (UPF0332 family)
MRWRAHSTILMAGTGRFASRPYYACHYATSALLLSKDINRNKHGAALAAFRQYFVKPGLIEVEFSDILGKAFETRQVADYDMDGDINEAEAETRLDAARRFARRVVPYLEQGGLL